MVKYGIKIHFGDVLTNIFYHWDVLTNFWGRFDQFGDVLTWGRFDCNPPNPISPLKHPKPPQTSTKPPPNRHQTTPNRHHTTPNHISLASPDIQVHLRPLPYPLHSLWTKTTTTFILPLFLFTPAVLSLICCQIIYKHLKLLTILLQYHCIGMVV